VLLGISGASSGIAQNRMDPILPTISMNSFSLPSLDWLKILVSATAGTI
jgi:hypothetical protein